LVHAIVEGSAGLGIPEYVLSFFAASLGTSLPELVVNLTAMRRGHREIALGGVLGACMMDASISLAAGPLLFPTTITASLALRGAWIAIATMAVAGLLLGIRRRHDRVSGALLVGVYLVAYALLGSRARGALGGGCASRRS
jgi:cation:H+ antiporter